MSINHWLPLVFRNQVSKCFLEALCMWRKLTISFLFMVNSSKPALILGDGKCQIMSFLLIFPLEKSHVLFCFCFLLWLSDELLRILLYQVFYLETDIQSPIFWFHFSFPNSNVIYIHLPFNLKIPLIQMSSNTLSSHYMLHEYCPFHSNNYPFV